MFRRIPSLFALSLAILPLAACTGGGGGSSETVLIGVAAPLTGDNAQFGLMIKQGVALKAEEINASGGILGKHVEILYEDDKADPKEAANVAQKLCSEPGLVAVVGHFNSSCSLNGKPIYKQNRVVQISPGSTNDTVCVGSEWTFRDVYRDDFQGFQDAVYAKEQLGVKRVAVFYDNDDYGTGLKNNFIKKAREMGLEIVAEESFTRDTQNFTPQLTSIQSRQPDLLFISGLYTQGAMIARQGRQLGMTAQFFGADGLLSADLIKLGGPSVEGLILSCPFLMELGGSEVKTFTDAFEKKFKEAPDAWAALGYDALGILIEAMKRAGNHDSESIRAEMAKMTSATSGYPGVTGITIFDQNGDCLKPLHFAIVKEGAFVSAPKQMGS